MTDVLHKMFHMDKVTIKGRKGTGDNVIVHLFDTMKERKS
jgi:hypothetical protein